MSSCSFILLCRRNILLNVPIMFGCAIQPFVLYLNHSKGQRETNKPEKPDEVERID